MSVRRVRNRPKAGRGGSRASVMSTTEITDKVVVQPVPLNNAPLLHQQNIQIEPGSSHQTTAPGTLESILIAQTSDGKQTSDVPSQTPLQTLVLDQSQSCANQIPQPQIILNNKVVSSNPTLNLLLSTPIKSASHSGPVSGSTPVVRLQQPSQQQQRTQPSLIMLNPRSSMMFSNAASVKQKISVPVVVQNVSQQQAPQGQQQVKVTNQPSAKRMKTILVSGNVSVADNNATLAQTSSSAVLNGTSNQNGSKVQKMPITFADSIAKMMHGFGDGRHPLFESARLVERITQHQLMMILEEAEQCSIRRGSVSIGFEDLLFMMRKDVQRLGRLIRFLSFKDVRPKLLNDAVECGVTAASNAAKQEDQGRSHVYLLSFELIHSLIGQNGSSLTANNKLSNNLNEIYGDYTDTESNCSSSATRNNKQNNKQSSSHQSHHLGKRVMLCQKFLSTIFGKNEEQSSGFVQHNFQQIFSNDFVDTITLERNQRLSEITQRMSLKDYQYFQACRAVSFMSCSMASIAKDLSGAQASSSGTSTVNPSTTMNNQTCRSTSAASQRFIEWLFTNYKQGQFVEQSMQLPHNRFKLNEFTVEILQYLAHETVGTLVELALKVHEERLANESDSLSLIDSEPASSRFIPLISGSKLKNDLQNGFDINRCLRKAAENVRANNKFNTIPSLANEKNGLVRANPFIVARHSITPEDIMEAMRRFEMNSCSSNGLSRFSRSVSTVLPGNRRNRILVL